MTSIISKFPATPSKADSGVRKQPSGPDDVSDQGRAGLQIRPLKVSEGSESTCSRTLKCSNDSPIRPLKLIEPSGGLDYSLGDSNAPAVVDGTLRLRREL
ncbi:MAG: hypothetical protein LBT47_03140 [Deltaproteobacteria bacterium]|jgi:hypothetical protein|nr:hypothetical protein [Deltaproteobacteria bacterium]